MRRILADAGLEEIDLTDRIKKARRHVSQNEGLIFEKSAPGKRGMELPPLDVPAVDARARAGRRIRCATASRDFPRSARSK